MFESDGKYGEAHIDGRSINIEKTEIDELKNYSQALETKRKELIEQQNDYLSKILS